MNSWNGQDWFIYYKTYRGDELIAPFACNNLIDKIKRGDILARKFNNGRLGEQLMNNDLFLAYNRIKYIGNGPNVPIQERQAEIPDYSLWIDRKTGYDVMKVWDQRKWSPLFEGYYHPANVSEQPANPVAGQLWVDSNGVLRFYQDNQWRVVAAASASNLSSIAAGVGNFLIMPDMKPITNTDDTYMVPLINTGKLFDNQKYIPRAEFEGNEIQMRYPIAGRTKEEKVSWVHVNPTFLFGANKKLIKVIDKTDYFINVSTVNTEFYGFNLGSPVGTFLRRIEDYGTGDISAEIKDTVSDYRHVSGGIQLINNGRNYDYIYAITYKFDSVDNTYGTVIAGNATIGSENDVYVGQLLGFPLVFLDGTYLEQDDYTYDKNEGMLTFSGETITNESDLVVAAFADIILDETGQKPLDFDVQPSNIQVNGDLVFTHDRIRDAARFAHPIVFVQGVGTLYDEEYGITDEVEIDTAIGTITVKNFGPIDENLSICIADIGAAKLSSGRLTSDGRIVDEMIDSTKNYIAFINGICTAPSDHEVYDGYIQIDKAKDLVEEDTKYTLMSLDKGDEGIDLMFDSSISYFTFQIQDNSEGVVYNDCDMVVSYVYDPSDRNYNGVLIDYNHMESAITGEQAYSTGQILKVKDEDDSDPYNYEYKIYNVHGDYSWTDYDDEYGINERNQLENMIVQFKGDGSISIMNNKELEGKVIEYYAYTYADEVDEPIQYGKRNYKIALKEHMLDANITPIQNFAVDRTQLYTPPGKGILGTYVNGIQVRSADDVDANNQGNCRFTIDTVENLNFKKTWGNQCDLYPLLKAIDDNTSLIELETMKSGQFANELKDYSITVDLLNSLKSLAAILKESETENELFYYIEKLERGETYSVNRDWLGHGNRFDTMDNAYTAITYIGPGLVDVYLNGVMLDRSSYSLFNNNHILLNDLNVAGGSDEYDKDKEETHRLIKYYIEEYDKETGETNGRIERVYCESPDELLIEYRPDVTLRKASYEIKDITYDMNGVFSYDDYEFPASLLNTKDEIKIWIDGILYTDGYYIEGKDIILENSPLKLDPIKEYFNSHPDTYKEWKKLNGEYSYDKSRVIFEWR